MLFSFRFTSAKPLNKFASVGSEIKFRFRADKNNSKARFQCYVEVIKAAKSYPTEISTETQKYQTALSNAYSVDSFSNSSEPYKIVCSDAGRASVYLNYQRPVMIQSPKYDAEDLSCGWTFSVSHGATSIIFTQSLHCSVMNNSNCIFLFL